ncbi:MAG: sensor domain-containing diguanylate cyclase [Planctomycetes bacterium]|nr:sensor domain-containing diguanylate cyclase [Planctomycetota bacterium]
MRPAHLEMLLEITRKMVGLLDVDPLLDLVVSYVRQTFDVDRCLVMLVDEGTGELVVRREHNLQGEGRSEAVGISRSVVADVLSGKGPVIVGDAQTDALTAQRTSIMDANIHSLVCLPLQIGNRVLGTLYLDNREKGTTFTTESTAFLQALANLAAVAIHNATLYSRSIRDALTGLCNHTHFEVELEREVARAQRAGRSVGLVVFDVDRFKAVNDQHGHAHGTQLLVELAGLVSRTLRTTDIPARKPRAPEDAVVGRYGGDEFEILLPETDAAGVASAGARLLEAVRWHLFLPSALNLRVTLSIGAAVFPLHGSGAQELFLRADEALYRAKEEGRNCFRMAGEGTGAAG